jgi:predicted MFS family arabinose efflux permease
MTKKEYFIIFILGVIQFIHIMDFMIIMPLGPQLMRHFSINAQRFSLLVASYTLSAGTIAFIMTFFIDRFNRKRILLISFIGFSLGTLLCALSSTYYTLLIARMITGAFGGMLGALVFAIIGDVIPLERRGTAMGLLMIGFSAASIAGVPFGLFLTTLFSWQAPYYLLVLLTLPITLLIIFGIPSIETNPHQKKPNTFLLLRDIIKNRSMFNAQLLILFLVLGQFSMIPMISPFLVSNVGFLEKQLILVYFIGGLASIFAGPIVGRLADRFGKHRIFTISAILSLIPIIGITLLGRMSIGFPLLLTTLLFIFISGRMIPAVALITSAVPPHQRGGFMSFNGAIRLLGSGLAAYLAGIIVQTSPSGEIIHYPRLAIFATLFSLLAIIVIRKIEAVS